MQENCSIFVFAVDSYGESSLLVEVLLGFCSLLKIRRGGSAFEPSLHFVNVCIENFVCDVQLFILLTPNRFSCALFMAIPCFLNIHGVKRVAGFLMREPLRTL